MTQEQFEAVALRALTAGDHPLFEILRTQLELAVFEERELTGSGFFLTLQIPADAPSLPQPTLHIGDVQFILRGVDGPSEAILHIADGYARTLEAYVYVGEWPENPSIQHVGYCGRETFEEVGPALFRTRDIAGALAQ